MTRRTGPTQKTRDAVHARDRACVIGGCGDYLQIHHRAPRKSGGTKRPEINHLSNLLLICLEHHAWLEQNRSLGKDRGLICGFGMDPLTTPVVRHGEWVLLTDDGDVVPYEGDAA